MKPGRKRTKAKRRTKASPDVTERRQRVEKVKRGLDHIRIVHEITQAVSSSLNLGTILDLLLEKIDRLLPYSGCTLRLLDREKNKLMPVAWRNIDEKELLQVSLESTWGLPRIVLENKAPLAILDAATDPRTTHPEFVRGQRMVSFLGVPLMVEGEAIGVLACHTKYRHEFSEEEIALLSGIADQAAIAIQNARLHEQISRQASALEKSNEQLRERTRQQAVVSHLGHLALAHIPLSALFDEAVTLSAQILKTEYGEVLELLPDASSLLLRAGAGWKEGYVGQATVGAGRESQAGYTLLADKPVIVEDLAKEARFNGPALLHEHNAVSGMSVVIEGKERPFGVLGVHTNRRRTFADDDVQFLQSVANVLGTAIERSRMEEARSQLAAIVESSEDAILGRTPEGIITSWNKGAEKIYGYAAEETIGRHVSMLIPPEDLERVRQNMESLNRGEQIGHYESPRVTKDGVRIDVSVSVSPVRDETGKIIGVASITRDITQRKRSEKRMRVLHEINAAITSTLDLKTVLDILLEKAVLLFPYSSGLIRLLDRETGLLEVVACRNLDGNAWRAHVKQGKRGIAQIVLETKAPLTVRNIVEDPRTFNPELCRKSGMVSFLGIPLISQGKAIGIIALHTQYEHHFTQEEIALLSALADQAAIAIQNAQLYEEIKTHLKELSALYEVTTVVNQSLEPEAVLQEVIKKITEMFHFDATQVYLLDVSGEEMQLKASFETQPELWAGLKAFKKGQGIAWRTAESGEPIIFEDIAMDPRYEELSYSKVSRSVGYRFFASFPVRSRPGIMGCIVCTGIQPRQLKANEVNLILSMANQIGTALHKAYLYKDSQDMSQELLVYRDRLRGLAARMIHSKEEEAKRIARELHDETGQLLAFVHIALDGLSQRVAAPHREELHKIREMLDQIEEQLRGLVYELRPTILDDLGLLPALHSLTQKVSVRAGIKISLEGSTNGRLQPLVETSLYRIVQEALSNVVKHAQATAVSVRVQRDDGLVQCLVHDDGIGFDVLTVLGRPGSQALGLTGMRERVETLGGKFTIQSKRSQGTQLRVTIPVRQ